MARIAGVNIPVQKHIVIGLTAIYGIGRSRSSKICEAANVSPAKKGKKYPNLTLVRDDCDCHIHFLVAIAFHGPRPKGMFALHKDDNGNNNHYTNIYWGTQAQNNAGMYRNGHGLKGEKHPNCTISDKQIREIRSLYATGFFSQQAIANKFGIGQSAVSVFVRKKRR